MYLIKLSYSIKKILNLKNKHIPNSTMKHFLILFVLGALIKVGFVIYTIIIYDVNIGNCYLKSGI